MNVELDQQAKELVLKHLGPDWSVEWSKRMTRAAGTCCSGKKLIKLSIPILDLMTAEQQKLVMLHEIAHGIVGCYHGHDSVWKKICREIGGDGKRCYGKVLIPTKRSTKRYVYECPICGRQSITRRKLSCDSCCRYCWDSYYDPKPLQLVDQYDLKDNHETLASQTN